MKRFARSRTPTSEARRRRPARLATTSSGHATLIEFKESTIAKNQNTYAKRQREVAKKAKAEAKRIRRSRRNQGDEANNQTPPEKPAPDASEETD